MAKVDRLLCHPYRVFVEEVCDVIVKGDSGWEYTRNESIVIPVDSIVGNPDPYVFHQPWLYGYCRNFNMPNQTSPQSIIIFGTYLNHGKKREFLVDTVFVVESRYNWLGKEGDYEPSQTFKNKFKYSKSNKLYTDFISPRVESGHHPKAKAIFAAEHVDKAHYYELLQLPHKRMEKFYSFIPLRYENGFYKLIDILPIIEDKYPTIFDDYNERRNRLYPIDFIVVDAIDYLIQNSNRLVVKTSRNGMPEKIDMNLQRKYYKQIYNIVDEMYIEDCCREICYSIRGDEE